MLEQLRKNWWVVALRGVAGVLFGVGAFVWPGMTLAVLVTLYGAYVLVDGVFTIAASIRHRTFNPSWWALLLHGIVSVVAGLVAWFYPALTALMFVLLLAGWAIATGLLGTVAAARLRKESRREWRYVVAGLATVALGVLIALRPGASALALVWVLGTYAIVFGGLMISLGLWLRALGDVSPPPFDAHLRSSVPSTA